MKNLSIETKIIWATYNFLDIAFEWWNAYKIEHGVQYLKWVDFVMDFRK